MKKLLLILVFLPFFFHGQSCDSLLLQSITNPGPFPVNNIDENSGIRNGPNYNGSTIYYPANNVNTLYSSIIMVPGFMNTELTIQNWGPFFASHGIITMTIGANGLTDTHIQRRDALLDAIVSLKNENQRVASPLFGKIDTFSIAVGGVSKGGGGAQLVPAIDLSIKAIVSLYPWLDNPTSSDLNHSVPVIIISGQLDALAPPSLHADIHYNLTPNTTNKLKYEVAFGTHDVISGPNGGNGEVGIRVISWLQNFLLSDSCYCPITILDASTSSSYITNVVCSNTTVGISQLEPYFLKKVLKIIDVFGREAEGNKNEPLFYIYNDGTVEKKIIIE
jgi:hypothetical protein